MEYKILKSKPPLKASALTAIFVFILLLTAIEYKLFLVPNSYNWKCQHLLDQSEKIECLILGSSHSYFGIKPDELSLPTYNLANTSQSLGIDTALLKHFINRLPRLQFVIIPISYLSMEYSILDSPESWRDCYTLRFLGACEANWWQVLSNLKYLSLYSLYGSTKAKELLMQPLPVSVQDIDNNGWFRGIYGGPITPQTADARIKITEQLMNPNHLATNQAHLEEILSLCAHHNIRVIFITLPAHKYYRDQMNKQRWSKAQSIVNNLSSKYKTIYLDYLKEPHFSTNDFRDNDHLNKQGATLLSHMLDKDLTMLIFY